MNLRQLLEWTEETVDMLNDELEKRSKAGLPINVNLAAARAYGEQLLACLRAMQEKEEG